MPRRARSRSPAPAARGTPSKGDFEGQTRLVGKSPDHQQWSYTVAGRRVPRSVTGVDKDGRLLLYGREEVWKHLAFNKYVHHGYRMALTPGQCLRSMLQLHNETGNIWSHFSVIFFFLFRTMHGGHWPGAPVFYYSAVIPCSLCLLCSSIYHTFMPLPYGVVFYRRLLLVDYLSVFNTMLWPQMYAIHYSLMCFPDMRQAAMIAYYVISLPCALLAIFADTNPKRLVPFGVQSFMRLVVLGTRIYLRQGSASGTLFYLGVEVTGITGGLLNVARAPERLFPGRFDIWLNSHQVLSARGLCISAVVGCSHLGGPELRA
jgi:predicted membrane channel-forming protein YqfA (hemolysin III family)